MLRSFCVKSFITLFCKYDILLTFLPPAGFINTYCHCNYSLPTCGCHVNDCDECWAVTVLSVVIRGEAELAAAPSLDVMSS